MTAYDVRCVVSATVQSHPSSPQTAQANHVRPVRSGPSEDFTHNCFTHSQLRYSGLNEEPHLYTRKLRLCIASSHILLYIFLIHTHTQCKTSSNNPERYCFPFYNRPLNRGCMFTRFMLSRQVRTPAWLLVSLLSKLFRVSLEDLARSLR